MKSVKMSVVRELYSQARRRYPRTHTVVKGVHDDLWQTDLIDMNNYPDNDYRYILAIIDVGSKLGKLVPLKRKTGVEVAKALKGIFETSKYLPRLIQHDQGGEYLNRTVKKLLKEWNIHPYSTYGSTKASVVERFIRTIKGKIWKNFAYIGEYKWVQYLPELLKSYNYSIHRSIGMRPIDVRKSHEKIILERLNTPKFTKRSTKFSVGDIVRISKYKSQFAKGYEGNFTTELFKIDKVHNNFDVPMFSLMDMDGKLIKGKFYEQEIRKTSHPDVYLVETILRKKGKRAFVKWYGFPSRYNSWINSDQIVT